ncbi:nickel-dependent lactate racemase family protein [Paenibacillus cymbidii]|uniref:nickel-dependent lactate racemase n=1 Tax=Paenibacillus cymbidii TaxID=1639034 RepID=UPI001080CCB9|nr:nickel-dependent lactate racemase [Paenibacillus cymbidii]
MYHFRYGSGTVPFELPDRYRADRIEPQWGPPPQQDPIRAALARPIGSVPLRELAAGKRSAVILVSDGTRLCPAPLLLEPLLDELSAAGLADEQIAIVVALGVHRRHTESELAALVGASVYRRIAVRNHSAREEDNAFVGVTTRGTPVSINRAVLYADLRIATGNIEPHRLAGMSGGAKALVPGVAARSTIEANHALSRSAAAAEPGRLDNPVRADMEEAQRLVPLHFLLNVIADSDRRIVAAFAGETEAAYREGVRRAQTIFFPEAGKEYALVIASPGGHPKDMQLYQSVKTLQNAESVATPGAPLVLIAQCEEYYGNTVMQDWLEHMPDREAMLRRLSASFVLGAHKIGQIAAIAARHPIYLHSVMPQPLVELAGLRHAPDLQATIGGLLAGLDAERARIALMPFGAVTFPLQKG